MNSAFTCHFDVFSARSMSNDRVPNGDFCNNLVDLTLKSEDIGSDKEEQNVKQHSPDSKGQEAKVCYHLLCSVKRVLIWSSFYALLLSCSTCND